MDSEKETSCCRIKSMTGGHFYAKIVYQNPESTRQTELASDRYIEPPFDFPILRNVPIRQHLPDKSLPKAQFS